jgi:hypothetical protein
VYAVTAATPSAPFVVLSPDGMNQLNGAAGSVHTDGFILISTLKGDIHPFFQELKRLGNTAEPPGMRLASNLIEIVSTTDFDRNVQLLVGVEPRALETLRSESDFDERKIGIYRLSDGEWSFVGGYGASGSVKAELSEEGVYGAIYNPHQTLPPDFEILDGLELQANFPNPFNPTTTIRIGLPDDGNVRLLVYDVRGQLIKELVDGWRPAGYHEVTWDGTDADGEAVVTGVYFTHLESKGKTRTRKMLLLK